MRKTFALVFFLLAPAISMAEGFNDVVRTTGRLSPDEFYRFATCGASPGGTCRGPAMRWNRTKVTLALSTADPDIDPDLPRRLRPAIQKALFEINKVGAGIKVVFVKGEYADIVVRPTTLLEGAALKETTHWSGTGVMGIGTTTVWTNDKNEIVEGVILIAEDIENHDIVSTMVEEVYQALGFMYDMDNPLYEGATILSETSNATTSIEGDDAMVLLRHYPPQQ